MQELVPTTTDSRYFPRKISHLNTSHGHGHWSKKDHWIFFRCVSFGTHLPWTPKVWGNERKSRATYKISTRNDFLKNLFNIPIFLSFWLLFLSQTENFHSGVASFCDVCVTPSQHRRERSKHTAWSPVRSQTTRQRESEWWSQRPASKVLAGLAAGQTEADPPRPQMTQHSPYTSESNVSVFCGWSILFFCFKSLYNSCHFSEDS